MRLPCGRRHPLALSLVMVDELIVITHTSLFFEISVGSFRHWEGFAGQVHRFDKSRLINRLWIDQGVGGDS